MNCPFCESAVEIVRRIGDGGMVTEMRCPKCSETGPGLADPSFAAAVQADGLLGAHALLDLIDWTLARTPAGVHEKRTPAELVSQTLRCVAVVARSSHSFDQRRGMVDRLLAGLRLELLKLLDGGVST